MALRERNNPVRLLWKRLLLLGLLVLVLFSASSVWNIYWKERESSELRAQAQAHLNDLQAREHTLDQQVQTLQSTRGQESAIRQQYDMAAQGENMVVIVEPDQTQQTQAATSSSIGNWFRQLFSRL